MKIRKIVLVCLALAIMLIPVTSCGGSVTYEAVKLVPEGINMLAGIRVSEALGNWQRFAELEGNEKTEEQFNEIRDSFIDEIGIDLNDISTAVIFARQSSAETME